MRLYVAYTGSEAASDVCLSVAAPSFYVVPKSYFEGDKGHTPQLVRLYLFASKDDVAQTWRAEVRHIYVAVWGSPASHHIPFAFLSSRGLRAATKQAFTNIPWIRGPPIQSATTLFQDLLAASHKAGVTLMRRYTPSKLTAIVGRR